LQAWFTEEAAVESDPYLLRVSLDAATVRGTPFFRSAQPNDAVVPFNWARGPRPLGDIFADRRWSQAARRRVPVVCDLVGPIWCPGAFLADRCRVTPNTHRTLMMTFGPIETAT
jgi:tRNA(Ile)-lysidine synthase